jgi:hypothetical protein
MTRTELLDAASLKLAEAVILLSEAGERRLAADVGEIAELIENSAIPMRGTRTTPTRTRH